MLKTRSLHKCSRLMLLFDITVEEILIIFNRWRQFSQKLVLEAFVIHSAMKNPKSPERYREDYYLVCVEFLSNFILVIGQVCRLINFEGS